MLVLIFCKESYRDFLPHCIHSIKLNVKNNIFKIVVVSNSTFSSEFEIITDKSFWSMFDPNFKYVNLWNNHWYRQQILKLNSDMLYNKDILVVDADLLFLKPVLFKTRGGYNLFTSIEYHELYFNTLKSLLNITKTIPKNQSFITDFGIFNASVLKSLKKEIQNFTQKNWLEAISGLLNSPNFDLSEYELYGNYFLHKYNKKVNSIVDPIGYKMYHSINFKDKTSQQVLDEVKISCDNYFQAINVFNDKQDTSSLFLKINYSYL